MKEEKHVQVGSKERIGDVWYFSANTYNNGGGYGLIYKNGEAYYEPQKYPKDISLNTDFPKESMIRCMRVI